MRKKNNEDIIHLKKKEKDEQEFWEISFFGEISNRFWKKKIEGLYEKGNFCIVRIDLKYLDKKTCSNRNLEILFKNYYDKYRYIDSLTFLSS